MSENIPYFEEEQSKMVAGQPIIERSAINAIIHDPRTNKYLCLDWRDFGWKTFIIGGIEAGEDPTKAALREIAEETGYTHVEFVKELGKTRSAYYAAHKKENRISNAVGLLFRLVDDEQAKTDVAESQHHAYVWVPKDEVSSFINLNSQTYIWNKVLEG